MTQMIFLSSAAIITYVLFLLKNNEKPVDFYPVILSYILYNDIAWPGYPIDRLAGALMNGNHTFTRVLTS